MTTKPDGESPSTSSLFLPRSLASSSSHPPHLERDILAQDLDQIHNTASQTESLTTFNEYTAPPPISSCIDGKGIASDFQGGLSGLYTRFRASVGNVRDIVTLAHDESADDKSLNSPTTLSGKHILGTVKLSTPPTASPRTIHSLDITQQPTLDRLAPGAEPNDKDQPTKQSRLSSGGSVGVPPQTAFPSAPVSHSGLPPLSQGVPGSAARPAVAEINFSAINEPDANGDIPSNGANNPSASQKLIAGARAEIYFSGNAEKPNSRPREAGGNTQKLQPSRAGLEGFDGINALVQPSAKSQSNATKNFNDAPRTIMNTATSRDDPFLDGETGGKKDDYNLDSPKDRRYQHLEIPAQKSLASPPNKKFLSDERGSPQNLSFQISAKTPLKTPRQRVSEHLGEFDARQTTASSESKSTGNPRLVDDPRAMNVFSQIKSKILNKEYWMRDENARDCFYCGDPFSTFRRKHHCSKHSRLNFPSCRKSTNLKT